jgi:hypothetical protein
MIGCDSSRAHSKDIYGLLVMNGGSVRILGVGIRVLVQMTLLLLEVDASLNFEVFAWSPQEPVVAPERSETDRSNKGPNRK